MAANTPDDVLGIRVPSLVRLLVMGASAIIILAAMKAAAEIVAPTLFAIFLALIASPLLHRLERRGLSTTRALIVMIVGAVAFTVGVIILIYVSVRSVFTPVSITNANTSPQVAQTTLSSIGLNTAALQPVSILSDKFALQTSVVILQMVSSATLQLILLVTLLRLFLDRAAADSRTRGR